MRYILILLFCLLASTACKTTKREVVSDTYKAKEYEKLISKYESLYYSLIDSIQNIPAPKEKSETKGLQRSELETSFARSIAFIDSLGLLYHQIENKDSIPQKERTIIDRRNIHDTLYVNRTDTLYVDRIEYVTEEPSLLDRIRRTAGDISIGILIVMIGIFIVKKAIKR